MDEDLRTLERQAKTGDREAAARLRRARERCSTAAQLLALMRMMADRIGRIDRRIDRVERFNKATPARAVPLPWRHGVDRCPFTAEAFLKRTWRKLYRAWLRETGKRAVVDSWLSIPVPKCDDPKHEEHNRAILPCVERRSIVLLPGTKGSWLFNIEWSENSRLIDRARRRAKLMLEIADRKKEPKP